MIDTSMMVVVANVMGVDIWFDASTGRFSARYNKGDGDQDFSREKFQDLEQDITKALMGFTGRVEVARTPSTPVPGYEAQRSRERLGSGDYGSHEVTVITGVRRYERDRYGKGGSLVFTTEKGRDISFTDNTYVEPNPELDNQMSALWREFDQVRVEYYERGWAIVDRYKLTTTNEIMERLRAQGAKMPRGA